MDLRKRLFRRPVTTALWLVVLMAMSLLLNVGAGVVHSAQELPAVIDQHHTTIAVQKTRVEKVGDATWRHYPIELTQAEIDELAAMDMVESVDLRTLTGAYIPELTSRLGLRPWGDLCAMDVDQYATWFANDAYKGVVLLGKVEQAWMDPYDHTYDFDLSQVGGPELCQVREMYALLNIEQVVAGHPDNYYFPNDTYSQYNGKVIVSYPVYDTEGENLFQVGETYIVHGNYDQLCSTRSGDRNAPMSPHLNTEFILDPNNSTEGFLRGNEIVSYDSCTRESNINPAEVTMDNRGIWKITSLSQEVTPLAARVDGTLEEFLADPANAHWVETIQKREMILHSFPVLGTQALESMYVFLNNKASIVDGRMFSDGEYENGERVCVISESVALAAGVQVGDKLSFSQFLCGTDYETGNYSVDEGYTHGTLNNPSIGFMPLKNGLVTEDESFEVVGIYRLENEWENTDYSISPNTVFIPQKAQIEGGFGGVSYAGNVTNTVYKTYADGSWEVTEETNLVLVNNGVTGIYFSLVLENGRMEDFQQAISESTLADRTFLTFDQGYEAALESVQAVPEAAKKLFMMAAGGWALLLAVYVLLYQSTQRKNLGIMRSLGASTVRGAFYLFGSGMLLAAVGIGAGAAISGWVMELVQDKLFGLTLTQAGMLGHSGGMALSQEALTDMLSQSRLPSQTVLLLAGVQLGIIAFVLLTHAVLLTHKRPRKLLGM